LGDLKSYVDDRFNRLEAEMDTRFDQIDGRFDRVESKQDRMQADLSEFHRSLGQHDKAIEILEKRK
jgi:septal ring factor EnvC (AmiA/AmiB activator)